MSKEDKLGREFYRLLVEDLRRREYELLGIEEPPSVFEVEETSLLDGINFEPEIEPDFSCPFDDQPETDVSVFYVPSSLVR